MILAVLNGLDFLIALGVIAGAFWIYKLAQRVDDYETELERRHQERMERIRQDLDREPPVPFDWAAQLLDEIDSLPEPKAS